MDDVTCTSHIHCPTTLSRSCYTNTRVRYLSGSPSLQPSSCSRGHQLGCRQETDGVRLKTFAPRERTWSLEVFQFESACSRFGRRKTTKAGNWSGFLVLGLIDSPGCHSQSICQQLIVVLKYKFSSFLDSQQNYTWTKSLWRPCQVSTPYAGPEYVPAGGVQGVLFPVL